MPLIKIIEPPDLLPGEAQGYYKQYYGRVCEENYSGTKYYGIYFLPKFILKQTSLSPIDKFLFLLGGDKGDRRENLELSMAHGKFIEDGRNLTFTFSTEPFEITNSTERSLEYDAGTASIKYVGGYDEIRVYVHLGRRHPNVDPGSPLNPLCLGNFRIPILNLCRDGDFYEASQIVKSVLHTYTGKSAYQTISDILRWEGELDGNSEGSD